MQFKKLTMPERNVKRWRAKRNSIVTQILAIDRLISREDALKKANKLTGPMPRN